MESRQLTRAIVIASRAFDGCTDRQGDPYIAHAVRVMNDVSGEEAKVVAMLHDTLEWGDLSWEQLQGLGFSARVLAAIDAMTDRDGETLAEQLARIRSTPLALKVKIADIRDNAQPWRLARLDSATRQQLLGKYRDTAELLGTTLLAIRTRAPEIDALLRRREPSTVPGSPTGSVRKNTSDAPAEAKL